MRTRLLIVLLSLTNVFCQGQPQNDIVLLTVRNDRSELAKVMKFLNVNNPRLTCVNVDLFECDQRRPHDPFPNDEDHFDSLAERSVMYPSEGEKQLSRELNASRSLLMLSEVRPVGKEDYANVSVCGFLHPDNATSGFINLIGDERIANQVKEFQVSIHDFFTEKEIYHFGVNVALALNAEKTQAFIKSHNDTVEIDFDRERKFDTYSFDDFAENKVNGKVLTGKVLIIGVSQPGDYFLVRKGKNKNAALKKMSTSEIFANIACQIIGE